ncbi:MAG: hypothetical protein A2Y62_18835 [Candidatus Fischerbacteria bacterium RBG_13_37_8]|uniref:Uncharacterized protein n=1 Tax=Candidatus Fischerbacteria bacterium RBG_13_37_8 TaxID=1817863 RepID=A0A1F5VJH7_9BACT|nr:MAG: hypothetical protein A2Y62_18835 [Candidatus Fischerbacteria bacterium RBG_13_37_8]
MIIRISKKNRKKPYTMIDNRILNDIRLSLRSRGMLCYLLSKPDDWTVLVTQLIKEFSEGKHVVRKTLNELIECGYIKKIELRNNGYFAGYDYIVSEISEYALPIGVYQKLESGRNRDKTATYRKLENGQSAAGSPRADLSDADKLESGIYNKVLTNKRKQKNKKKKSDCNQVFLKLWEILPKESSNGTKYYFDINDAEIAFLESDYVNESIEILEKAVRLYIKDACNNGYAFHAPHTVFIKFLPIYIDRIKTEPEQPPEQVKIPPKKPLKSILEKTDGGKQ